jgi:hypothetical protein
MNAASEQKEKYGTFSHDIAPIIDSVNPAGYIDIVTAGVWWAGFRTTSPFTFTVSDTAYRTILTAL